MLCLSSYGQSIKGHYLFKPQEGGAIFHLYEVSLFEDESGNKLKYDITYSSKDDVAFLNFTYVMPRAIQIDSIKITSSDGQQISGEVKKLYIEPTKRDDWTHRYSLECSLDQLLKLYDNEAAPRIELLAGNKIYSYSAKESAWKRYAPIGAKIFEMITLQK